MFKHMNTAIANMLSRTAEYAYKMAWRENRMRDRVSKRIKASANYHRMGLNGQQAVDRRRRQILSGQLTASNGLVRE